MTENMQVYETRNEHVKGLVQQVAETMRDHGWSETGMQTMTERRRELEGIGRAISKWTEWDYEELRVIAYAALEDANDHSMAAPLYEASEHVATEVRNG